MALQTAADVWAAIAARGGVSGTLVPSSWVNLLRPEFEQANSEWITRLLRSKHEWEILNEDLLLNTFLRRMWSLASIRFPGNEVYIHPRAIGFNNKNARRDWTAYCDWRIDLDLFGSVKRVPARRPDGSRINTRIFVFITPTVNWIKRPDDWRSVPWHAWAAAIVSQRDGYGKHLLIYEGDSERTIHQCKEATASETFRGLQRKFFEFARDFCRLEGVWIGNLRDDGKTDVTERRNRVGKLEANKCIVNTLHWVHRMSHCRDSPFDSSDMAKWYSFRHLGKITESYLKQT